MLAIMLCTLLDTAAAQESNAADWLKNPALGNYTAYAEFKMANYAAARQIWETLAGLGNPDALFNLGILAEDGLGEAKDIQKAVALYEAAANAGGFKAQYRLGMLYSDGGVVSQDVAKAAHYLSLAAANGDKEAAARLASLAQPARPPSDFEQAERLSSRGQHAEAALLFKRLAEAGNITATTRLAWMYEAGRGVERNLAETARLFMLAASAGDAEAEYAVAVMYRTGKGQPLDRAQSLVWLRRAAGHNYPAAVAALAAEGTDR
ncbi:MULTISPECIES: tetratricopeptide repeat protein [Comamonadaceae]|uniref:tetratricopeptide repeat protein n=1 Tax=Comamonadaceae TaxID=80864 RepID=UPI00262C0403|nr:MULTISPECIES: tetratricopeptide repeat protein [Comamonadaceae]HQS01372.1 tetratricopeptide repeat protein [Polaromonas sp.]